MKAIVAEELGIRFGHAYSMANVNFTLEEGEFLALIGHNGVGKTTLLRLVGGLQQPTAGTAYIFGRPSKNVKDICELVGMVNQTNVVSDYLTVREYLGAEAKLRGIPTDTMLKHLELTELTDLANRRIKELSIGSKRKIVIVKAIMHAPRILLLDEPSAGLDPMVRRWIWDYLANLKRQRISCIIATHSMEEVSRLCDKALLMRRNKNSLETKLVDLSARRQGQLSFEYHSLDMDDMGNLLTSLRARHPKVYLQGQRLVVEPKGDPYEELPAILTELLTIRERFRSIDVNQSRVEDLLREFLAADPVSAACDVPATPS